ncbi:TniQ family protein [Azospirillum sp. B21]|uniref:TniQ family protein n=1 Tax=Azospirillum sp. B21 TaxID=2607496 RepID=UPI0011EC2A5D|nr:TniQ family protein [Azospirillum sp. B21]KAA0580164.1 TniQ family protein [Azospirillum sp. B21]
MTLRPWPCRPKPLPDELLSSWIARTAIANGLTPGHFIRAAWPEVRVAARDIDHVGPSHVVERMAARTLTDPERAWSTTLGSFSGFLFEAHAPADGRHGGTKWITRTRIAGGIWHWPGQQFCPACLAEDPVWMRRSWRLALSAVCPHHGCVLADRCGRCEAPVTVIRADHPGQCHACQGDLSLTPSAAAPWEAIALHRRHEAILARGWAQLGEYSLYSTRYFDLLHYVLRLLAGPRYGERLRTIVSRLWGGDATPPVRPVGLAKLETLSPGDRARLLDLAARLLPGWPYRFVGACAEAGAWQGELMFHFADAPFAFADPVRRLLHNAPYRPTREEAAAAAAHLHRSGQPVTTRALSKLAGSGAVRARLHRPDAP